MFHDVMSLWEKGCSVVPLRPKAKAPEQGFDLSTYFSRRPTLGEIRQWFGIEQTRRNVGLVCGKVSGVIVVDCDSRDQAVQWYRRMPRTAMSKTGEGVHFFYGAPEIEVRPRVRIDGMMLDIRGECSYVVAPPSIHPTGKPYEWVEELRNGLPIFDPAWIEEEKQPITRQPVKSLDAYLAKIESRQGNDGSAGLVRFIAVCRDNGLSEAECMARLVVWNQGATVSPPWSLEELARATTRTYQRGR